MSMHKLLALWGLTLLITAHAEITVHSQIPIGQMSTTAPEAAVTTYAAYNDTILIPPPIPDPAPATSYTIEVQRDAVNVPRLSVPHTGGAFWGFSIEMSVINQVLGKNSTFLQVPFLNLMANLVERAGSVYVRLGGNTQEHARMVDFIENYNTQTPAVLYTVDMFYIMNNISSLTNVKWFLGIPFDDTVNWRLQIAENAENILGEHLLGLQTANEPDFYLNNGHRQAPYTPYDFFGEMTNLMAAIDANPNIPTKNNFLAPNLGGEWTPEMVWETGFLDAFRDRLFALTVEHYPNNNCYVQFGTGRFVDPQEAFAEYLTHQAGIALAEPYRAATMIAQEVDKPFIMFETNTASCGGFQGISDSYGAALWAVDYGMQLANSNFTNALMHVGGQNVFYNPFTAPPTNQSSFHEWTVGAVYYSALVLAEAFGKSNTSRIIDVQANGDNYLTPAYAIYENDVFSKMALFNYVDDDSGASDRVVSIAVPGAGVPESVRVKYLSSESVSFRNITWAGQTFGPRFTVDGRLKGDLNVVTILCDRTNNTCQIPLKAPDFALVFFNDVDEVLNLGQATQTFATTAQTKVRNTVSVDQAVLETSNGHSEKDRARMGSTSSGSVHANSAAGMNGLLEAAMTVMCIVLGVGGVLRAVMR
ncbi:glycoside hydrolase family 79 protein [Cyathus striatus]|nr:glycoside hydrolase family 79 protein [Cyathus striatus]